jgi:hypothetical protein
MARRTLWVPVSHLGLALGLSVACGVACGGGGSASTFPNGVDGGSSSDSPADAPGTTFGSGDAGEGSVTAPASLYFVPNAATVIVTGSAPQQASFTLTAKDANGNVMNVTPDSVEFDRPDLATVTPNEPVVATAPSSAALYAGVGTIHAIYAGKEATATLTVQVQITDYGPGLSAASPGVAALGGQGLASDPAPNISPLLYPYDQTVWPLGLTSPLVMWNAPQTGDVYRMHYAETNYSFDGYYTLGSLPAQMRLAQTAWDQITASNNTTNGADPLSFSLSRWDHVANVAYATSAQTWTVAGASLRGAIYYWTASQNAQGVRTGHITRFQPGTGAQPEVLNNGKCMGCHAVNAQGTTLVADIDDLNASEYPGGGANTDPSVAPYGNWSKTRPWASFDITNVTDAGVAPSLETNMFGADLALTPDGKYVVFGGPTQVATGGGSIATPPIAGSKYMSLATVSNGAVIPNSGLDQVAVDTNMGMMMPAFSPDGTKLAVIEGQFYADNVIPNAANPDGGVNEYISYLAFDESGPTFSPTLTKLIDGSNLAFATTGSGLAYPSFTPDSMSVAFHAGTYTTGCNANGCDDTTPDNGNLFIATLASGTPIRLATADDPPNPNDANSSVEPTFNPIQRGGYSWVVFTSMRAWGNQPWPADVTSTGLVNGKRRLWVAAIDPTIGTVDPSHPAIYLEGQEDSPNMRGFWTLAACIATPGANSGADAGADAGAGAGPDAGGQCTAGFQCCSGFCENGQCIDINQLACAGVGDACTSASDCCNAPAVSCTNGTCGVLVQ